AWTLSASTRTSSLRSSTPCSPRATSAPSTNTSPGTTSITTRPWASPPAGRSCARLRPHSVPRSPTGTATSASTSKKATWWSRSSRRAARSRETSSECPHRAAPSACPGSTSGGSATASSLSAGDAWTISASCASSAWSPSPDGATVQALALARAGTYRRVMADAIMKRQVTALIGRCYSGLDVAELRDEVLRRLRRIMSVDAAFFGTIDPQTLLFTSAVAEEPLGAATPLFLDNEYGRADVNKFVALAEAADQVSSLDRATRGQRPDSARYREVMSPLGLGDELRAVLISGKQCWGAMCLHREDAEHGFDDQEVDVIRRIAPHVAEGLRRAVTLGPIRAPAETAAAASVPGIILLDQDLALMSMSPEAARWLAEIDEADWPSGSELPMAVYAAAARLARLEQGAAPPQRADMIRLRSRAGQWLSLHASRLGGGPAPKIGVVIEPTPARCCSARTGLPARSRGWSRWSSGATPPARSSRPCTSRPTPSRST